LNSESTVKLEDILEAISNQKQGTKTYKGIVSAMKKLCRKANREDILHELNKLDVFQTEFLDLQ
jgi:hypothetical protein